jgi:Ni,Fe-hydrogenase III large subunit
VLHLEIQLGYQHRGVERLLLGRDPRRLGPLVETAAGDTSVAHAWAYCAALEALAEGSAAGGVIDGVVDGAVERGRALLLELERVAMHLATLSGLAADIGFLQGATAYGRLRTTVINTTMRLTGSRFGRGGLRPGASAFGFDAAALRDLEAAFGPLTDDLAVVHDRLLSDVTVQHRLVDVGVVSPALAAQIGLVGVAARASGQRIDQRSHDAGLYAALPLRPQVESSGDCLARTRVRVREIHASLDWIRRLLAEGLELQRGRVELGPLRPNALVVTVVEGLRGEVVHALETDARGALLQYKVQDPSLRNWLGLALAVRGGTISDFPICNKSFDLSYCGHDL